METVAITWLNNMELNEQAIGGEFADRRTR
jgi:hypothetical protein